MKIPHQSNKFGKILILLAAFALAWVLYQPAGGAQDKSNQSANARIDPAADELLHKMSDKLANAKQFTVEGERTQDPGQVQGEEKGTAKFEIAIQRPNGLKAKRIGGGTAHSLFFDGRQATLLDDKMNLYASVAAAGTIDEMLDSLHEKYGFTPPMADFLVQDPYADLTRDVLSGSEQGKETVNGTECHHLAFKQDNHDWEIWIAVSDLLPRKFVIDSKDKQAPPQLTATFTRWDLAPQLSAGSFTYQPSQGAEKIDMIPTTRPERQ